MFDSKKHREYKKYIFLFLKWKYESNQAKMLLALRK